MVRTGQNPLLSFGGDSPSIRLTCHCRMYTTLGIDAIPTVVELAKIRSRKLRGKNHFSPLSSQSDLCFQLLDPDEQKLKFTPWENNSIIYWSVLWIKEANIHCVHKFAVYSDQWGGFGRKTCIYRISLIKWWVRNNRLPHLNAGDVRNHVSNERMLHINASFELKARSIHLLCLFKERRMV